jgi:Ca-activated chloride channel homolog
MIEFDYLWLLYVSPVVAVFVTGLAWWARRARVKRAGRWSPQLEEVAASSGARGAVVLGLAAFFATVALSGPRFGARVVTTESKALNLVIAVDVSRSMLAEDVNPSRLARAQREASRLLQDLRGDRIGLIAFSGRPFILSPLTVDAGALRLLVDGLHPDLASTGGTSFAPAIRQAHQLLIAGEEVADRVLVVFSDGEELDSVPPVIDAMRALQRDGIKVIFVAEGGREGARIPVRDPDGVLLGYQRDADNEVILTRRRDDVLSTMADVARGTVVSAEVNDQAGAVRDLVVAFKRAPQATTTSQQDVARGWIAVSIAIIILLLQTMTRRTAALAALAFLLAHPGRGVAQGTANAGNGAWQSGDYRAAAEQYLRQVRAGQGGDTSWFNLGTAALAIGDTNVARRALTRGAESLDAELRFRALYNLGLLDIRLAERDSLNRQAHLEAARDRYRQALLLRPGDRDTKWNYELVLQRLPPPQGGDGASPPPPSTGGSPEQRPPEDPAPGLTLEQAEQLLNSMLEEERATREELNRRQSRTRRAVRRKDW